VSSQTESGTAPAGSAAAGVEEARIWRLLGAVPDPEIPVVSILDLGIVRYVRREADGRLHVGLTPTYLACPATEAIRVAVRGALDGAGHGDAVLDQVLSPPWSSEWLSPAGRRKLAAYGIAPPVPHAVHCPRCGSSATERLSEFGSTPCKAHYRCRACLEPFDAFKCI
jgi:ring-1,2-phenylacetyl-CoA epoxidase subunit PaaD